MNPITELTIDTSEAFQTLANAPIVEAVLEVRTRAAGAWEESPIVERLKAALPDYPLRHSGRLSQDQFTIGPQGPVEQTHRELGWMGVRCQSEDKLHVAQFTRDAFVFSRLRPYDTWDQFRREALRLWNLHRELAKTVDVQRLGLRFINRIPIAAGAELEAFFYASPQTVRDLDLPFGTFLHQDTFVVPGHPYGINRIQTVQDATGPGETAALILDIDVFTIPGLELEGDALESRLAEMRWLKNRVFFGSITQQVLERFG